MKTIEEMTVFELKKYRDIIVEIKNKYAQRFYKNNIAYEMFSTEEYGEGDDENSKRFNFLQKKIEYIDKLIEKKIFEEYV